MKITRVLADENLEKLKWKRDQKRDPQIRDEERHATIADEYSQLWVSNVLAVLPLLRASLVSLGNVNYQATLLSTERSTNGPNEQAHHQGIS